MTRLFVFGIGYTARVFARRKLAEGWQVHGTTRGEDKAKALRGEGFDISLFSGNERADDVCDELRRATHLLVSIGPGEEGDPVLACHGDEIAAAPDLDWIGYLSTVGVYGDHAGAWVGEDSAPNPKSKRSVLRLQAENDWLALGRTSGKAVHVFRLAGIYGPRRGPLENVLRGKARRIVKPGQVFNRIHVDDIATVLEASVARPRAGGIYNVADDEPAPPQDVVEHACKLTGVDLPPEVAFEDADLSPMGRSFYGENKRVSNRLIKEELGVTLAYPTYREGMAGLAASAKR